MSVYGVLSCFRKTRSSADVGSVRVGWAVGLAALAGCRCGRRAARAPHRGEVPAA